MICIPGIDTCVATVNLILWAIVIVIGSAAALIAFSILNGRKGKLAENTEENPDQEFDEIPPFRVGEITDLIKGLVDFKVREIKVTSDDKWEFHGTALVHLPTGSTTPEPICVISGKDGNITSFSVPYLTAGGKPGAVVFGKGWSGTFENADEEDEKYYITIDDVESA